MIFRKRKIDASQALFAHWVSDFGKWTAGAGNVDTKTNPTQHKKPPRQNLVGPRVASLRRAQGLSQDAVAARCARLDWDISENGIAKIETQVRCVTDAELFKLARALRVKLAELVPASYRQIV